MKNSFTSLLLLLVLFTTSCAKEPEIKKVRYQWAGMGNFTFKMYGDLAGTYILRSNSDLENLKEATNGDINILGDYIEEVNFDEKMIVGIIGEIIYEEDIAIIFKDMVETEDYITINTFEKIYDIEETEGETQPYSFAIINKTDKSIIFNYN
ncbi:hypothetical protein [Christiangramia aquimixticola]|uniref:hypothetical protein n=1 Tax=Christiangramia aquimixticola TaxID=1697558 RepID=UPI003AA9AB98